MCNKVLCMFPEFLLFKITNTAHHSYMFEVISNSTVLEITVGHWPFSNQFQHLAIQNLF